ncbi:hypothetical protein [Chitinophaga nivalis]|uniref:DUF4292 domain-containing protein n=1 Tax=Chitinophaga nivalis TaxID=2991709 RepID=A0ABT3IFP1_9BACT|nr:hypothetical protein [Chitinophaga nivalis]MCW3467528.1 hypothetical protein [Chitinophaga nivalis]MCW3482780.1 hypothetical protein [Chitinophaga nivalis]
MRYFLLNSILVITGLLTGCRSSYKGLQRTAGDVQCIRQFSPQFTATLYSTQVNVLKHHLSGLLFFKQMPDSSVRVVFANEMGFKFFDFEFDKQGNFTNHFIIDKMNKKAVVKTLRQDFALVLLRPDLHQAYMATDSLYRYVAVPTAKGHNYYMTDTACTQLIRIEQASKRRPAVKVWMQHYNNGVPDTIQIQHQHFRFNISLQRVEQKQTNTTSTP